MPASYLDLLTEIDNLQLESMINGMLSNFHLLTSQFPAVTYPLFRCMVFPYHLSYVTLLHVHTLRTSFTRVCFLDEKNVDIQL